MGYKGMVGKAIIRSLKEKDIRQKIRWQIIKDK